MKIEPSEYWNHRNSSELALRYKTFHVFQISVWMNSSVYISCTFQIGYFGPNDDKPIQMALSDRRLTSIQVDGHEDRWNCHQVAALWPVFRMYLKATP